jgi:cobaltochelatase CobS
MGRKRKAVVPEGQVSIPGTKVSMTIRPGPRHALVPQVKSNYHFRSSFVEEIVWAIEAKENVLLVGDTSTGKSSLVEQLAAYTNTPLRRVNLHGESDTTIFVGRDTPVKREGIAVMEYRPGLLAEAMVEGHWLLLDEVDAALQPVLFVFQQVLEENGKLLLEDEAGTIVEKHPDFRIFATSNTIGIAGRNKLLYTGTMGRMNEATLDRFGVVIHLPYLSPDDEIAVICSEVPDLDSDFVRAIVKIANEVRTQLENEQMHCTLGLRRCIHWARAMVKFRPMRAARMTVLHKLDVNDAKVLEGVIQRFFGGV